MNSKMILLTALLNLALWFLGITILLACIGVTAAAVGYWLLRKLLGPGI